MRWLVDRQVIYSPGIGPFGFSPDPLDPVIERDLSLGRPEDGA